jgi:hypothetical protein
MRTATFASVLEAIATAVGLEITGSAFNASFKAKCLPAINRRLRAAWSHDFWDEITPVERRAYRAAYAAGTAYAAPTLTAASEVYDPASDAYYQALKDTTGHAPATLTAGVYVVNGAYWAACADDYEPTDWLDATVYAVGDQVRNPADGRAYQCHTAHTAATALDATKFGVLTPFRRYVSRTQSGFTAIGEIDSVTARDPRIKGGSPGRIPFELSNEGIVPRTTLTRVWVRFRRVPSVFTLTAYGVGTAYTAGARVYDAGTGECYLALAASTGVAVTDTTKWELIPFPEIFVDLVTHGVAADLYRGEGQDNAANSEQALATDALATATDEQFASQGQFSTAQVNTY